MMSIQVLCLCVALSSQLASCQYSGFYTHSDFLDMWTQIKGLREEILTNYTQSIEEYLETQLYTKYLAFLDGKERQRQQSLDVSDDFF